MDADNPEKLYRMKEGLKMDHLQEYFSLTEDQLNRLTPQHRDILNLIIIRKSITPMDAFQQLGITKLATRISEMKRMGIHFDQTYESYLNYQGRIKRYMRYRKAA